MYIFFFIFSFVFFLVNCRCHMVQKIENEKYNNLQTDGQQGYFFYLFSAYSVSLYVFCCKCASKSITNEQNWPKTWICLSFSLILLLQNTECRVFPFYFHFHFRFECKNRSYFIFFFSLSLSIYFFFRWLVTTPAHKIDCWLFVQKIILLNIGGFGCLYPFCLLLHLIN